MRVQMQGEAAEKFALENQKIALRLGRSFGEFLSLFIVFYAIGKKIWSVTREKRQDGEAEQQLWGAGEGRQESYPGLASDSSLRPLPSPDPGDVGLRRQLRGWGGRWWGSGAGARGAEGGNDRAKRGRGCRRREPLRLRREGGAAKGNPSRHRLPSPPKVCGEGRGTAAGGVGARGAAGAAPDLPRPLGERGCRAGGREGGMEGGQAGGRRRSRSCCGWRWRRLGAQLKDG